ncbi:MAG: hypothetical protein A2190_02835 [Lysobacterales bacterium RIFOXYA1_FULL_69_10]|nr:MAG: hypothetical protein A2190_02835 [Xanthomonadales bacterium RIFOXYA1_FULL_69_10]
MQLRQRVEGMVDHRDDRGRGRTRAVEHAVEHVLDLPAELAQRLGADQAPAALQGVEDAADRAQKLGIVRRGAPRRQQLAEVVDLFLELFEENLTDFVVDVVAVGEAAVLDRQPGRHGRLGLRGLFDRGRGHGHHVLDGIACDVFRRGFDLGGRGRCVPRREVLQRRRRRVAGREGAGWNVLHVARQRPVAQRLQALARDLEDAFAVGALLAQCLQVVLHAGQRVGHGVELLPVGHALAADQFDLGVAAHADQVFGGTRQFQDAQGTGHFVQQARHVGQFGVVPVGFHERNEALASIAEVGNRFAHDDVEHLARFAGQQVLVRGIFGQAQSRDLLVQGRIDVEQCTGDVQQRGLVGGALAGDDLVHRVALLQHHAARYAQAHHAERVADAAQRIDLRAQLVDVGLAGAQVQVQRILDPQQVFLDRRRNRVQKRAVAAAQAAAGVLQLRLAGALGVQVEGVTQAGQRGVRIGAVGRVVQQLPGRLGRGLAARAAEVVAFQHLPAFALDAAKGLAQGAGRFDRAVSQRSSHRRGDPQHAAQRLECDVGQQAVDRRRQRTRIRRGTAVGPLRKRIAEVGKVRGRCRRHRGEDRRGQVLRQRPVEVGREQHALVEPGLAARRAQLVEQRQQDDRDVAVAALQALQVVGQLDHTTHQRGTGVVAALLGVAMVQRQGEALHLLGHHRRGRQFDHPQRAAHLVQVAGADLHALGVAGVLGVGLDLFARLPQGLVQLGLDPAEGGGVDGVAHHGHAVAPRTVSRPSNGVPVGGLTAR